MSTVADGGNSSTTMAPAICCACEEDIDDDATCFECDGCVKTYHIKCDKVKKSDVSHRSNSERLKIFCGECCKNPQAVNDENIKTILKFIYKIDAKVQQQAVFQTNVASQLEKLTSVCTQMKCSIGDITNSLNSMPERVSESEKKTFASIVRAAKKPAVIIKPKVMQQNSKATIDDIKSQIDYKHIDVCDLRNVRGGGIAVMCESDASTLKMKDIITNKFGEKYDVKLPEPLKPRVKIVNAMNDVSEDQIIVELKRQNEWLTDADEIEVKKVIERKKSEYGNIDIVLEVNIDCFDKIMTAGKVNLGWKKCNVVHHVHITRCYKCCGFSHISSQCKNKTACGKCGLDHQTKECARKEVECINCKSISQKYKLKLDCKHHAFSHKCPTLLRKVDRFARNFKVDGKK